VTGGGEFPLHIVDREIAFAHRHGQSANAVAGGGGLRSALRLPEEGGAFVGVVAELMAEDTKSALGVAETASDLDRGLLFDEEGAEGFVLALQGKCGRKEEMPICRSRYLIGSAGMHNQMMLPKHSKNKMFY